MKIFIFNFEDNFDKKLIQHFQLKSHFPLLDWNVYFPKDLCEIVRDPSSADYIIFSGNLPCAINNLSLFNLLVLFYNCELFHKYYWKFIFIYNDDNTWRIPMGGTWLRVSIDKQLSSSESISIPYLLKKQVFQREDLKNIKNKHSQQMRDLRLKQNSAIELLKKKHREQLNSLYGRTMN